VLILIPNVEYMTNTSKALEFIEREKLRPLNLSDHTNLAQFSIHNPYHKLNPTSYNICLCFFFFFFFFFGGGGGGGGGCGVGSMEYTYPFKLTYNLQCLFKLSIEIMSSHTLKLQCTPFV
jgi:hypothetical protein